MPRKAPRSTISRLARLGLSACLTLGALHAGAQESQHQHHHGGASTADAPPPVFVASTAKSFGALMDDAMNVMDAGMKQAPMNGVSEHDFVTMMMPHHQGAVDMAKAVLLYTQDPEIRNLALGIIAEQQNEIKVMQAWLQHHAAPGQQ
jgi:uncharacterized protein (DUF305 family)